MGTGCLTRDTLGVNRCLGPAEAGRLMPGRGRAKRDLQDPQTLAGGCRERESGKVGGTAGPGMEQSWRQWMSPPALAQGPNQKKDYCFTAVLMHWADTKLGRLSAEPLLKQAPHTSPDKVRWLKSSNDFSEVPGAKLPEGSIGGHCAAFPLELRPVVHFACPDYAGCFPIKTA